MHRDAAWAACVQAEGRKEGRIEGGGFDVAAEGDHTLMALLIPPAILLIYRSGLLLCMSSVPMMPPPHPHPHTGAGCCAV